MLQVRAIKSLKTPSEFAKMNTEVYMGLENYLGNKRPQSVRLTRGKMYDQVFKEQIRQDQEGIYDPDTMARVSSAVSKPSRRRAQVIGMLHANNDADT